MIRDAIDEDIEILLPLAIKMHSTSKVYADLDLDLQKVRDYAKDYIDYYDRYFRVYEKDGRPVAFFLGYVCEYFFGNQKLGIQENLFTNEENPMVGIRLSKDFEAWCKERGAIEVNFGITTSHDRQRHDKFMARLGYRDCGTVYKKRI
jgi:hypothetical protein